MIDEHTADVDTRPGSDLVCPHCRGDDFVERYEHGGVRCLGCGELVSYSELARRDGRPRPTR